MSTAIEKLDSFKRLPKHDQKEVKLFARYLRDKEIMPSKKLFRKYQKYLGLSDAELKAMESREP